MLNLAQRFPAKARKGHKKEKAALKEHKLHALCPYFAMFPPAFAREQILAHTKTGELCYDPFSGRGTTLLEALLNDRKALASDINPVAYCISVAKAQAPTLGDVLSEIDSLQGRYRRCSHLKLEAERRGLPSFFRRAFDEDTLRQVLFLRSRLEWQRDRIHQFIRALVLGHLHGELDRSPNYLSNQMPHSISPKPSYSLRFWRERNLWPPERDVFELLEERAEYRLEGDPVARKGCARMSDVRRAASEFRSYGGRVTAVITSPPYLDMTNCEEDQWLRLWFLGGPPYPTYNRISTDDRHTVGQKYWGFLTEAWTGIKSLLKPRATIVCRIGAKELDPGELSRHVTKTLHSVWPEAEMIEQPKCTFLPSSQAKLFSPQSVGCRYEIDLTYIVRN